MRKWNALISGVILVMFLIHAVVGSMQLFGIGSTALKTMAYGMLALIAVHVVISVKLTADTLRAQKAAGTAYWRQNALFWARRISGFAIMLFLGFHLTAFGYQTDAGYRLRYFDTFKLVTQILLVITIAVHVISNAKPILISFGIRRLKERAADILFVLSVLLLLMGAAIVVYYIRWNSFL